MKNNNKFPHITASASEIFPTGPTYLDSMRVYFTYFQQLPCIKSLPHADITRAIKWFLEEFKSSIYCQHSKEQLVLESGKMKLSNLLLLLHCEIAVNFNRNETIDILFKAEQETEAQDILEKLKQFIKKEKGKELRFLISEMGMLSTIPLKIKKPQLVISKHYNDDLLPLHKKLLFNLKPKDESGLVLLHGAPGTGKSTYLRYLIHYLNKKIIFISPKMAANLDSPDNFSFLLESKNSIFIIEDAEELLLSRESNQDSRISMLLNLTDGLLGTCLGIQIIATFNTSVLNIDPALLRKGRLIARYEFKPLTLSKTKHLLNEMNIPYKVDKELTLADIFNLNEHNIEYIVNKENIGFQLNKLTV